MSTRGSRRNTRSRRQEAQSPDRDLSEVQVETLIQGNETLTNVNTIVKGSLGGDENWPRLIEPNQISNEIQAWIENFEQKNNNRILKMREEMENKFDAILKELRTKRQHQQ